MRRTRAFTLIELMIVIAIIGVLIGLLMPVVSGARDSARKTACASNLRQLFAAMTAYATDNNQKFPYFTDGKSNHLWELTPKTRDALAKFAPDRKVFFCPSSEFAQDVDQYWDMATPDGAAPSTTTDAVFPTSYTFLFRRGGTGELTKPDTKLVYGGSKKDKTPFVNLRTGVDQGRAGEMELAADLTISKGTTVADRKFAGVSGSWKYGAIGTNHVLRNNTLKAQGGNILMMTGGVEWRPWKELHPTPDWKAATFKAEGQMLPHFTHGDDKYDVWF